MKDNVMLVKQHVSFRQCHVYVNQVCLFVHWCFCFEIFIESNSLLDILVCINHVDQLCSCSPKKYCLWYRYSLDEMTHMLDALRERLDLCQKWKLIVGRIISVDQQNLIGMKSVNMSSN